MKTLTRICADFTLNCIFQILSWRKRTLKNWMMNMDQWITAMKLPEMKVFLQMNIGALANFLIELSMKTFSGSRVHDILG